MPGDKTKQKKKKNIKAHYNLEYNFNYIGKAMQACI